MDDSAIALAKLINSPDFQRKLNEIVAERKAADEAKAVAETAKAEAQTMISALNDLRSRQQAELSTAKAESDKAAREAALRIQLGNSLKAELDTKKVMLDDREAKLAEREKAVASAHSSFSGVLAQLGLMKP